ncbi:MAG: hypothetical protein ACP5PX_08075 [Candidatus Hadarchaeum sp.]|uniref:hypothetical protein n=1 Tax=Candidatus Hadarchaeum sp. TaxID=2883567 RepID=UPI003D0BB37A
MYKPKIFIVGENEDNLIALEEASYVTEEVLQEVLARYPDLLPGDQIDPENPRRWLFVAREMGIPGDANEGGRWSLDLLFLDQDGIPTFVECKRATDTRTRREVVAQMLDYAANGVEYWDMDRLRQAAAETARSRGRSLDDEISSMLGESEDGTDVEGYWEKVEANLRNRRVRLVLVSDSTPKELRRLVEFLNEEMRNVEVLTVEVKQFQREGDQKLRALVPRVVGLTETARSAKESSSKRKRRTTRKEFLEKCSPEAREFFQRVLDRSEERGHVIHWGELGFSVRAHSPKSGGLVSFAYGYPPATFQFYFDKDWRSDEENAAALRERLLNFGVFREAGQYTLTASLTEETLVQMDDVYDFILEEINEHIAAQRGQ